MKRTTIILLLVLLTTVGCGKVTKLSDGTQAALTYNDGAINAETLYEELKQKYGRDVLVEMIDEILLTKKYPVTDDLTKQIDNQLAYIKQQTGEQFLEAIKYYYGINSEAEFKDYLAVSIRKNYLTKDYVKANISDDEVKKFYDEKVYGAINASHILVSSTASSTSTVEEQQAAETEALNKANDIIARLNNGEDFGTLAKELSDDTGSRETNGNVGSYVFDSNFVEEFKNGGKDLEVGKYTTTPVKSQYGYHIILKVSQEEKKSLDEVKESILTYLSDQKITEDTTITNKMMDKFRTDNGVKFEDDYLQTQYNELIKTQTTASN